MCVAAFLASIATSIAGLKTDNETVVIIGTISGIFSAAIYSFCEAWVDAKATDIVKEQLEKLYDEEEKENE